jgi:glycosyltransferase involved in cell wall biosynthesis
MPNPTPETPPDPTTAAPVRDPDENPVAVSVIIPCYNGAETLGAQLESLAAQTWSGDWEVIVADNGSTDDSVAVAAQYQDVLPLEIIDAGQKKGQAYAYNQGVTASTGPFLLFCDADDVMHPGYVEAMVGALHDHPYVGGHERHDHINPEWLQARARTNNKVGGLIRTGHLPFVAGCTIGVRRSAYERVGGFDESIFELNDMDFAWRLAEQGVSPTYVPEAQFYYRSRPTLWGNVVQEYRVGRGFQRVHHRHGHECEVQGDVGAYLRSKARPILRQALRIRSWGDLLLWCRRVAWTWGLAHEALVGKPDTNERTPRGPDESTIDAVDTPARTAN